ncbi:MAG: T9SS type A sorting domain-containing protein [Bacteroidetes bacterium]|nr:T9SS type A sorting domain-containing protein [Bacteroidota bacterium]
MPDSGDVTIQVKVVDGNDSTTNEIMLKSAWLKVNLISQADSLDCNSNALLIAYTSGSTWGQQGKFYHWYGYGDSDSASFITISQAGIYYVKVENSSGCLASDTVEIKYRDGVSNHVDFDIPYPVCQNCTVTFTNTSEKQGGVWKTEWELPGCAVEPWYCPANPFTAINPGGYSVRLTMDSAGCRFSITKVITVLPETSPYCTYPNGCTVGIEEDPADRLIQISPNPNAGRVSIHLQDIPLPVRAELYDLLGRKMNIFQITQSVQELDLSLVEDGIYFLLFHQNERTVLKRVVISR